VAGIHLKKSQDGFPINNVGNDSDGGRFPITHVGNDGTGDGCPTSLIGHPSSLEWSVGSVEREYLL
jgi:hypothetical protein